MNAQDLYNYMLDCGTKKLPYDPEYVARNLVSVTANYLGLHLQYDTETLNAVRKYWESPVVAVHRFSPGLESIKAYLDSCDEIQAQLTCVSMFLDKKNGSAMLAVARTLCNQDAEEGWRGKVLAHVLSEPRIILCAIIHLCRNAQAMEGFSDGAIAVVTETPYIDDYDEARIKFRKCPPKIFVMKFKSS